MADERVGCLVVLDDNEKLRGILTDRDVVVRGLAKTESGGAEVSSVMSEHPYTTRPEEQVMLVARKMAEKEIRRVPVVGDDGKVLGVVSVDDLLAVFISELSNVAAVIAGSSKLVS